MLLAFEFKSIDKAREIEVSTLSINPEEPS